LKSVREKPLSKKDRQEQRKGNEQDVEQDQQYEKLVVAEQP
jgi:hypothetical protein